MQGENERQWKKVNWNTYAISSIKRVTKKFLEVSRNHVVVVQNDGTEMYKKVCCMCKVAFFFCLLDLGYVFLGKSKSAFPDPKTNCAFFGANPKTDHESIKSTFRVDSSDQIQIRIFEIHNLSVFMGKDLKKYFWLAVFWKKKNVAQQMPYMYDILTEPMLVAPY